MSFISAIIPSLVDVDKKYLKLCVESLRESGFDGDIIVVANGSRDMNPLHDTPIKGISKFIVTKQQGQANAVNVGAQLVEGDCKYLFVINSDMYFAPGWDNNLRNFMDDEGNFVYKCFSPNLVEPTNNLGSAEPFIKLNGGFTLEEFNKNNVDNVISSILSTPSTELKEDYKKLVEAGKTELASKVKDTIKTTEEFESAQNQRFKPEEEPGFNLPFFIDRELWNTIGGYDTKYDPWGSNSDTDLQTLINIAGVTPMRLRDVLVYHFSNKSGTFDGSHQEEWQKNFDYYRTKFGYTRDDEPKADVWYNKNMVLEDKLIFHPEWKDKYV